jgi:hypothetical protein
MSSMNDFDSIMSNSTNKVVHFGLIYYDIYIDLSVEVELPVVMVALIILMC